MRVYIFRTRRGSSQFMYHTGINLLSLLDIPFQVRFIPTEDIELLEKNKVLKWNTDLREYMIGDIEENYLEIGYIKQYLLLFTDESRIVRVLRIIPETKDQERIVEEKVIPSLRSLEKALQ